MSVSNDWCEGAQLLQETLKLFLTNDTISDVQLEDALKVLPAFDSRIRSMLLERRLNNASDDDLLLSLIPTTHLFLDHSCDSLEETPPLSEEIQSSQTKDKSEQGLGFITPRKRPRLSDYAQGTPPLTSFLPMSNSPQQEQLGKATTVSSSCISNKTTLLPNDNKHMLFTPFSLQKRRAPVHVIKWLEEPELIQQMTSSGLTEYQQDWNSFSLILYNFEVYEGSRPPFLGLSSDDHKFTNIQQHGILTLSPPQQDIDYDDDSGEEWVMVHYNYGDDRESSVDSRNDGDVLSDEDGFIVYDDETTEANPFIYETTLSNPLCELGDFQKDRDHVTIYYEPPW